jgi:hypothetical protein
MNALSTALDGLQDRILHADAAVFVRVRGADAAHRLRIYADAYRLRLVEVLGNDFPMTRDTLGEGDFAGFAERYLQAHPSTLPSVRHLGSAFAGWLETRADAPPGLHELARFEWLQATAFDAPDAPSLDIADIAALAPESWPSLRFQLHPCVQLLDTARLAVIDGTPTLADGDSPIRWLLWRDADGDVHWRSLEADEADALHAVSIDCDFGELCQRISAPRAASLLKRWLADGLLASDSPPSD